MEHIASLPLPSLVLRLLLGRVQLQSNVIAIKEENLSDWWRLCLPLLKSEDDAKSYKQRGLHCLLAAHKPHFAIAPDLNQCQFYDLDIIAVLLCEIDICVASEDWARIKNWLQAMLEVLMSNRQERERATAAAATPEAAAETAATESTLHDHNHDHDDDRGTFYQYQPRLQQQGVPSCEELQAQNTLLQRAIAASRNEKRILKLSLRSIRQQLKRLQNKNKALEQQVEKLKTKKQQSMEITRVVPKKQSRHNLESDANRSGWLTPPGIVSLALRSNLSYCAQADFGLATLYVVLHSYWLFWAIGSYWLLQGRSYSSYILSLTVISKLQMKSQNFHESRNR